MIKKRFRKFKKLESKIEAYYEAKEKMNKATINKEWTLVTHYENIMFNLSTDINILIFGRPE